MGLYSRWVFPWLCELALGQPFVANHRKEQLAGVHGEILEIGVGTGLNLPHYPPAVRKIVVVEPNPGMNKRLRRRIQESGLEVDQRAITSEGLCFDDCQFDCVVSSFTLCSIKNVALALRQVHRVLKPSGRFVFLEHGLCPDASVRKWQRRLNPVQGLFADGCRLDVDISSLIESTHFRNVEMQNFYLEKTPRTHGYMYRGTATK